MNRRPGPTTRTRVVELRGDSQLRHEDRLSTEEPLEIRLTWPGAAARRVAVTMRTPGHDFELAAGWLVHERVTAPQDIAAVRYCTDAELDPLEEFNVVTVELTHAPAVLPDARTVTSACGVCGKDSIAEVLRPATRTEGLPEVTVPADLLGTLPERLLAEQEGFTRTGGMHAAALVEADGTLVVAREDVGRHNALDKVVGARLLSALPVPPVLVLSGRIGFELVQKAVVSRIPVLVAVGAPSSLAVRLAAEAGLTLVGFARPERCVVYSGEARITG